MPGAGRKRRHLSHCPKAGAAVLQVYLTNQTRKLFLETFQCRATVPRWERHIPRELWRRTESASAPQTRTDCKSGAAFARPRVGNYGRPWLGAVARKEKSFAPPKPAIICSHDQPGAFAVPAGLLFGLSGYAV